MKTRVMFVLLALAPTGRVVAQIPPGLTPEIRQVPLEHVDEADRRPLALQRTDYLRSLIELELDALGVEADLTPTEDRPTKLLGIDRASMLQMRELLDAPLPDPIAPAALPIADKYLFLFAVDRLDADSLDVGLLEKWERANRDFLANPTREQRQEAIVARRLAFLGLDRLAVLRGIANRLSKGPIGHPERIAMLGRLQKHFPDAPFFSITRSVGGPAGAGGGNPLDALLGGGRGSTPSTLLDALGGANRPAAGGLAGLFGGATAVPRGGEGPAAIGAARPSPAATGPRIDGAEPGVPLPDIASLRRPVKKN